MREVKVFGASSVMSFFFFVDPATTVIYTLSLHDALPILSGLENVGGHLATHGAEPDEADDNVIAHRHSPLLRSEEHTSELQSRPHLVCRLLLEKKKTDPPAIRDHARKNGTCT